ncbi:MAG: hypothetical protein JO326_03260 [Acetobacteraceae bacterium]|nr:hypothetical protein [Acetobacteraceae bacterium]
MPEDTIVAVYDSPIRASAAANELARAGVPAGAIRQFNQQHPEFGGETTSAPAPEQSFWAMVFGSDPEMGNDRQIFEESVQRGGTVLTVTVAPALHAQVAGILVAHSPMDLDEVGRSDRSAAEEARGAATSKPLAGETGAPASPLDARLRRYPADSRGESTSTDLGSTDRPSTDRGSTERASTDETMPLGGPGSETVREDAALGAREPAIDPELAKRRAALRTDPATGVTADPAVAAARRKRGEA